MYADKERRLEYQRVWRRNNPKKCKEYHEKWYKYSAKATREQQLQMRYGISIEDFDGMLAAQDGRCGICGTSSETQKRKFAVDHDHKTGKIRGLLCVKCNAGIGNLRDDINIVKNAVKYLSKYNSDH